jgi:hypothetical protein
MVELFTETVGVIFTITLVVLVLEQPALVPVTVYTVVAAGDGLILVAIEPVLQL